MCVDDVKFMECLVVCGSCQVDGVSCCVWIMSS